MRWSLLKLDDRVVVPGTFLLGFERNSDRSLAVQTKPASPAFRIAGE